MVFTKCLNDKALRKTAGPGKVETMGIEPIPGCLQGSLALPWYMRPQCAARSARDSNPVFLPTTEACRRNTCRPANDPGRGQPRRSGASAGGRRQSARASGLSLLPSADIPLSSVAEVGVEPTVDHQVLDLAALPDLRTRPSVPGPGVAPSLRRV